MNLDLVDHYGEHRHLCPTCEQTWWHEDGGGATAAAGDNGDWADCVEAREWDCPMCVGLSKASVEPAA